MVYEKLNFNFNVELLRQHIAENLKGLAPVERPGTMGGWSVLSSDGKYTDGWHKTTDQMKSQMSPDEIMIAIHSVGGKSPQAYTQPTEICHGYLKEVIDRIALYKLQPKRARLMLLRSGGDCPWHRDAPDETYCVRLHVPIITNADCFFETRAEKVHLPADGQGYFLFVNREHRVMNNGTTDRYHLVMDVVDSTGVTQFHGLENFKKSKSA